MMKKENKLSRQLLSALSDFVTDRIGIYFAGERWGDLERGISSASKELGFGDVSSCARWLLTSPLTRKQIEVLASYLTVGETYFFRDKRTFEVLEHCIFSELITSRCENERSLRIWSAGCATGEEAYSIAILLKRMLHDINDWNITVLATDINPLFLRKASDSIYTKWSFRDVPPGIREQYFRQTKEGGSELLPHIKKMVTFSYHNLVEDTYPSLSNDTNAMDVILCRNVLMYFSQEVQLRVVKNLHSCLKQGGWLIVSPSEVSQQLFLQFSAVNVSGATFYRKDGKKNRDRMAEIPTQGTHSWEHGTETWEKCPVFVPTPEPAAVPRQTTSQPDTLEEARELYGKGCYGEAIEEIISSTALPGNDAGAMEFLSRAFANQGKLDEALKWCERSVAASKMNPGGHYLMAMILQEQGKLDEAAASFRRALYLDQDFIPAHFALGNLAKRQGKPGESARHFKNAKALLLRHHQDDVLAETDGITAGRLMEIIESTAVDEAAV
jgi:chemotaxis protein methyltransferase CheR